MTAQLSPAPVFRSWDNLGFPLAGGKLFTYAAGTTTPQATYVDSTQTTPNTNPVILNFRGEAFVWLDPTLSYKYVLQDAFGNLLWTEDNISGGFGASPLSINLIPNPTNTFTLGDSTHSWKQLYLGANAAPAFDATSGNIGFYARTGAEITAAVFPTNFTYQPYQVQRYMSAGQLADYLAGTALVDQTSAFALAEQVAYIGGAGKIYAPAGKYRFAGTVTLRAGVTLFGDGVGNAEYFPGGQSAVQSTQLWKQSTDTSGAIFILQTAVGLKGVYFRYDLLGGSANGVLQIGTATHASNADSTYGININDVSLYGAAISGTTLVDNTCAAIYFMDGSVANATQRYANKLNNISITNFATGVRLGENCNANVFANFYIRNTYFAWVLNGGTGTSCVENAFGPFGVFAIGNYPAGLTPIIFSLSNGANNNAFGPYSTENLSTAFSIDASSTGNQFLGHENESVLSVVPAGNFHSLWTQPNNRSQVSSIILPTVATPLNYSNGQGNLLRIVQNISGTLPTLNGSGTLVAADPSSKVFARFNPTLYSKGAQPCLKIKLAVFVDAPGGGLGEGIAEVEFWYRATDNATHAASLSVISVSQKPATNYIAGLKFLTGVASGLGFGLAIVGGNIGAVTVSHLIVDIEILAFTFATNSVSMANYNVITWGTAAATANDVTDAISLLTVADTAV